MAKKPQYRLQALLRLKTREKHLAEIALARALRAYKKAQEKEEELRKEREDIVEAWHAKNREMDHEMSKGAKIFDGNTFVNFLRKLKEDEEEKDEEIEEQEKEVERCKELVAKKRRGYIDAARELQVMEKHKELWWKKILKEISREEEKQFDELCSTIHSLRGWRGEGSEEAGAMGY
jgi:flagellar export protein FliJ